jgi:hemoglobin
MHAGNGDLRDLGERFARCFDGAMDDAGLPADPEFRAAMNAYMRWAVDTVALAHPDGTAGIAPSAAMPRWGWDGRL